jgi:hypothetical protein
MLFPEIFTFAAEIDKHAKELCGQSAEFSTMKLMVLTCFNNNNNNNNNNNLVSVYLQISEADYRLTLDYHGVASSFFTYNYISLILLNHLFLIIFLHSVYVFYLLFSLFFFHTHVLLPPVFNGRKVTVSAFLTDRVLRGHNTCFNF